MIADGAMITSVAYVTSGKVYNSVIVVKSEFDDAL